MGSIRNPQQPVVIFDEFAADFGSASIWLSQPVNKPPRKARIILASSVPSDGVPAHLEMNVDEMRALARLLVAQAARLDALNVSFEM
jgi:hypothetical protein